MVLNADMSLRGPRVQRGGRSNLSAEKLRALLQHVLREPVQLTITDNTHVFLNACFKKKRWQMRLHWMFLEAPISVQEQVARYILTHSKTSSKAVDQFIEDHWHWVRHPLPPIQTKGKIYDLEKIFDALNVDYFDGKVKAKITWGKSPSRRSYEELQMGSYSTSRQLITVHPHLDQKFVPHYVVEATIFHEMCHAVLPVQKVGGRKQIHPPAFKKLEEKYIHYAKAREWEEEHLTKLFRKPR